MRAEVSIRDGISGQIEKIMEIPNALTELAVVGAQVLVEQATAAFTRPNLRPAAWPERKDDKPHPLLQKSKMLIQSLVVAAESNGAVIGSDRPYAAVHQLGSAKKNIPARPFFPFDESGGMTPQASRLVDAALRAKVAELLGGQG